ncbi:DUF5696 domain-containing protein [Paenibacillus mendelii]|uniref:DUF5696 domain-containing protein n=1 Tax=Paenibacillus mendelii TaxID=206163 RepID=A0ABV6JIS7_9BACL|nr:DUF5696 domain-containing protein [Paenibacillus mendelii]MCQ6558744.1 DUF5696 domain-containing protein [Paenibacillus mendelii]
MAKLDGSAMLRVRKYGIPAAIAALLLLAALLLFTGKERVPTLQEMGLPLPSPVRLSLYEGEEWRPRQTDAEGFAPVLENRGYALYLNPETSVIALRNKQSDYLWRSNPQKEKLAHETVKGTLLSNLQSPFILEYHERGKTQRSITNATNKDITKTYRIAAEGLQVTYSFSKLKISFTIQYALTEHGMEVRVPATGIREAGDHFMISLQVLPFFGAARNEDEQGYLFVPDGPGGIIRFDENRTLAGLGYRYPMYGNDLTNQPVKPDNVREATITYPVFGLKRGSEAFVAILKDGKFDSLIKAQAAGTVSSFNTVGAEWTYRVEYGQRLSQLSPPVNTIQQKRIEQDRVIEYRLLSGENVGYVEMAQAYRTYLQQNGDLRKKMDQEQKLPLQLTIVGGSSGSTAVGRRYAAATTFAQAEEMISELSAGGVEAMDITLRGWQAGGAAGQTGIFPAEQALGGNKGARSLVEKAHQLGYKVLFEQDFVRYSEDAKEASPRTDGIRGLDGSAVLQKGMFVIAPEQSAGRAYMAVDKLQSLGADGVKFAGYGEDVYKDYHPDRQLEREQTALLFRGAMEYAGQQLGHAAATGGGDYILAAADSIHELEFESSYDFNIDETVPFYPIVLHGLMPYSFTAGNLRDRYQDHFLKAIEYGAVPSFIVTDEPSIHIRYTLSGELFSTHFAKWKERILQEYTAFKKLSAVHGQAIVGHRKLENGVYATEYEGGTQTIVDYNTSTFRVIREE